MNSGDPYTKIKILAIKEFEDLKQLSEISKLLYIHWLFQLLFQPFHITPASSGIIQVVLAIATLFSIKWPCQMATSEHEHLDPNSIIYIHMHDKVVKSYSKLLDFLIFIALFVLRYSILFFLNLQCILSYIVVFFTEGYSVALILFFFTLKIVLFIYGLANMWNDSSVEVG